MEATGRLASAGHPRFKTLHFYYQNVRGLRSKTDKFHNNVTQCNFDFIALTETFLTSSVCDGELFPSGWTVARRDRAGDAGWGGVLLAARECYSLRVLHDIDGLTLDKELLFAIITFKNLKFLCCVAYLPPSYNEDQYMSVLSCIENAVCKYPDLNFVLLGDFNLNSCNSNIKANFEIFCNFCKLDQYNSIKNNHGGILDLVLSDLNGNNLTVSSSAELLVPMDAYHPPLVVSASWPRGPPPPPPTAPRPRDSCCPDWDWRKADYEALYPALVAIDWADLLVATEVDSATKILYEKLYSCISQFVPLRNRYRVDSKYVYPKWYTPEIIRNIKLKYFHLLRFRQEGKDYNTHMFKYYRTHVKNLISKAYKLYIQTVQNYIISCPVKFWEYVKDKKSERQHRDKSFTFEGRDVSGQDAADAFAKYFSSVFQQDRPRLDAEAAARVAHSSGDSRSVSIPSITEGDFRAAIQKLKPRSSGGPDGVPVFLAKDCASALMTPLLYVFNLSLKQSIYPSRWKKSRVTPVPKGGSDVDVTSFRPIAVLSVFGKIFEMTLNRRISQQISDRLHPSQHGFRKARSTTTNLIALADYVCKGMDAGHQVDAAYFDFRKAFDLVDNDILLGKLALLGFTPKLLSFFASYLCERQQYVRVGGFESNDYCTLSGVSQGSTLGPTLFLLMINDLPDAIRSAECLLFADDLKLLLGVSSVADSDALQSDISAAAEWSVANRLPFNTAKCKVITFSRKRSPILTVYSLGDACLERVDEISDLGLNLDSKLNFHKHVSNICKKASKTLGFVMRASKQFHVGVAMALYSAYVRSRLEYGAVIWDPYENKYSLLVERVQRKFARWVYRKAYGYYPYMYPSLFVSGMVGLDTLSMRRKLLLLFHFLSIVHHRVDSPAVLERIGLVVPTRVPQDFDAMAVAPRRRPGLLQRVSARTCHARHAPTARALSLLYLMLTQHEDADLFADSFTKLCRIAKQFLDNLN